MLIDRSYTPVGVGQSAIFAEGLELDSVHPPLQLIGVGPGDPELLTIAAVRAIEAADVIAYPVAKKTAAGAGSSMDWPLAMQQDGLLVRPCPDHDHELECLLDTAQKSCTVLALMKLGLRWPWVRACLERRGLLEHSLFAQRVGWPDQVLERASQISAEAKPYFSLLLIRQHWPEVLP